MKYFISRKNIYMYNAPVMIWTISSQPVVRLAVQRRSN